MEPEEAKKAAAAAAALEEQASLCISKHCECTCCGTGASIYVATQRLDATL